MAKARMLHKSISVSLQVNKLSLPARLLFTWLIPHADDDGKLCGEPEYIKATVVPMTRWSFKRIAGYLQEIKDVGLIYWWVDPAVNERFIEFINWKNFQSIKPDRYKSSKLPSFQAEYVSKLEPKRIQINTTNTPQSNLSELRQKEINKSEYIADKNLRTKEDYQQTINPQTYQPSNSEEYMALRIWKEFEPINQLAFTTTYLYAARMKVPVGVMYAFASEIRQDPNVENKGAVFQEKVKQYLTQRNAKMNK